MHRMRLSGFLPGPPHNPAMEVRHLRYFTVAPAPRKLAEHVKNSRAIGDQIRPSSINTKTMIRMVPMRPTPPWP